MLPDSLANKSTLGKLKKYSSQSFEELIRGKKYSFGGILGSKFNYKAVPSPNNKSPGNGSYYNGGSITQMYTLINNFPNFKMAGFQMELPKVLRFGTNDYLTTVGKNLAACIYEYYWINSFNAKFSIN